MSRSGFVIVTGKDGVRGIIETLRNGGESPLGLPAQSDGEQRLTMQLDDGDEVLAPIAALVLQDDGTYYLPFDREELEHQQNRNVAHEGEATAVLPLIEEQLDVQKRMVQTGKVRINKRVSEREELIDETLMRDDIEVQRVDINRVVDGPVSVRSEGDTTIIPLLEEVLIIEKRLILKEELRVTRRRSEIHQPQRISLRNEQATVERLNSQGQQEGGGEELI